VPELALELADGQGAAPVQLREHVRLGLGHADVRGGALQVDGDAVDSALQIGNHFHMGYYDMGMTDEELLRRFELGTLDGRDFPHERHVRVAWLLLREYGREAAFARLVAGIRGVARRAGRPEAFHLTITRAWFELVAAAPVLDAHPELLDRSLLGRYYSPGALASGRERWVEPDLRPLRLHAPPAAPVDLAAVMRGVPAVVAVLSTHAGGTVHAATVSSATSVSLRPPLVSVCLARSSRALALVRDARSFTLSLLASGQERVAQRFADPGRPPGADQFAGVPHHLSPYGPVVEGATTWLGCSLRAVYPGGDHEIVLGRVAVAGTGVGHPLVRYDGAFL
jgi:flavin reductase (DIM6/NTAB) family NADH-FMN oxidoreductase RutF